MQQKFARFWALPGTIGSMSRISPPSPAPSTPSPGKMRSSTGVRSVSKPSTTSRPSLLPGQSLPSRTLISPSGCTPMPQPQASELSSLKYEKARSASFVVPCAPLTRHTPTTKLECLAIVWAVAKFRPYLMPMSFEVYTDDCALQWLKTMRTGSALLHRWSAALEEYDFTVRHRPGKSQTHLDGLSCLPVDPPLPPHLLKTPSFKFACWRMRRKPEKSPANYMLPPTSTATLCGNSSVTAIPIKQVAASVWRPPRAAHSAN